MTNIFVKNYQKKFELEKGILKLVNEYLQIHYYPDILRLRNDAQLAFAASSFEFSDAISHLCELKILKMKKDYSGFERVYKNEDARFMHLIFSMIGELKGCNLDKQ